MNLQQAISTFLVSGSVFVNPAAEDVIVVPASVEDAVEIWKLASQLNKAGLQSTDYLLSADQGTGRSEQITNLLKQIERALLDAGFSRNDADGSRVYSRTQSDLRPDDNRRWADC